MLEAALAGKAAASLADHLESCGACAEELAALSARRERLDSLLPLVAHGDGPSPEFRARVLARAEAASEGKRARPMRGWALAGAGLVIVASLTIAVMLERKSTSTLPPAELAAAENLAKWRAPSDVLLETPGRELLRTTPRLGKSYLNFPLKPDEEE